MSQLSAEYYPISTSSTALFTGRSVEAIRLEKQMSEIFADIKPTAHKRLFDELEELSVAAQTEDWDNLGSAPLDHDSYQIAKKFILSLPSTLPPPELTVDRDGEVTFDWQSPRGQMLSASLRKDGRLAFACYISKKSRFSSVEDFNDAVPKSIIEGVKKIFAK